MYSKIVQTSNQDPQTLPRASKTQQRVLRVFTKLHWVLDPSANSLRVRMLILFATLTYSDSNQRAFRQEPSPVGYDIRTAKVGRFTLVIDEERESDCTELCNTILKVSTIDQSERRHLIFCLQKSMHTFCVSEVITNLKILMPILLKTAGSC